MMSSWIICIMQNKNILCWQTHTKYRIEGLSEYTSVSSTLSLVIQFSSICFLLYYISPNSFFLSELTDQLFFISSQFWAMSSSRHVGTYQSYICCKEVRILTRVHIAFIWFYATLFDFVPFTAFFFYIFVSSN